DRAPPPHGCLFGQPFPRAGQESWITMSPGFIASSLLLLSSSLFLGVTPGAAPSEGSSASQKPGAQVAPIGMDPVYGLARATDVGPANPEQPLSLCVSMPYAKP